jgi:hypothetical protein
MQKDLCMHRRDWLTAAGTGVPLLAALGQGHPLQAGPAGAGAGRRLPPLRIFDVKTILTAPAGRKGRREVPHHR